MEFIMFVGIPGSGKSYMAEQYAQRGYHVHSSDAIRKELFGDESIQGKAAQVFDLLLKRVRQDLSHGISCVMDATNLRRKRRMAFLNGIGKHVCCYRCILVLASVEECLRRNASRQRTIDSDILFDMPRNFEPPYYYEGWDVIEAVYTGEPFVFPFEKAMNLSQDNPFHSLTLGQHMIKTEELCRSNGYSENVCEAARYHDCGKLYTKKFFDAKGQPTKTAHYYGHEGYSAYLYLCEKVGQGIASEEIWQRVLFIASLISWHMAPMNYWRNQKKAEEKNRLLIGEHMYQEIQNFHEADQAAH